MKLVIIGHRGVGKSHLLQRIKSYRPDIPVFDLDQEIEKFTGKSVREIFSSEGESSFRQIEVKVFEQINQRPQFICVLGAGFNTGTLAEDVRVLWLKRDTDGMGRVFLDRPRLDPQLDPLQEYLQRYQQRESKFSDRADWIYEIPEGLTDSCNLEKQILFASKLHLTGFWTLMPSNQGILKSVLERTDLKIELRTDHWTPQAMSHLAAQIPTERLLVSHRTQNYVDVSSIRASLIDWALDLGPVPIQIEPTIVSLHSGAKDFDKDLVIVRQLGSYEEKGIQIKWSPEVETWQQLQQGLAWQSQAKGRSFLPRSPQGRWRWVRQYLWAQQSINFCRLGEGSAIEQPTLFEALDSQFKSQHFAAILGSPVLHSWTPGFHHNFFATKKMPVYRIRIEPQEFAEAALVLRDMGLAAAAVTSPLKLLALNLCGKVTSRAEHLGSVNTLVFAKGQWSGDNTDIEGVERGLPSLQGGEVGLIFGGGGTLALLRKKFPQFQTVSARTGKDREGLSLPTDIDILVWASGETTNSHLLDGLQIKQIWDLNYTAHSPAKQLALKKKCSYISGEHFFVEQAKAQQNFWGEVL